MRIIQNDEQMADALPKRDRRVLQEMQRIGKGGGEIKLTDFANVSAARARELIGSYPYVEIGDDGVVRQSEVGRQRRWTSTQYLVKDMRGLVVGVHANARDAHAAADAAETETGAIHEVFTAPP